ncbi:MAG: hypothetical protein LBV52_01170 [Spirochaetaceae bacterium]|jgi:adenylate cyclase|nr:hypothetical protein [Spirochaetaceae bacterium]
MRTKFKNIKEGILKDNLPKNKLFRAKYPIGLKLIAIITPLLVLSLSAIIVMVSALVSNDMRITAEDNNFNINQRVSLVSADFLNGIITTANDYIVNNTTDAAGSNIAAIVLLDNEAEDVQYTKFINTDFWVSHVMDIENSAVLLDKLVFLEGDAVKNTRQSAVLSETKSLGEPLLMLIYPIAEKTAIVAFSAMNTTDIFSGNNTFSFLINNDGKVLLSPKIFEGDATLLNDINNFTHKIFENDSENRQLVFKNDQGHRYFGAYNKINDFSTIVITLTNEDEVLSGITKTIYRNSIVGGIVLLLSIMFIVIFSRSLSIPLKTLMQAATGIENGVYNIPLARKNRDEIGVLFDSFTNMRLGVMNFERFSNKTILRLARDGKLQRGGVNKTVTVAFLFIRNFNEVCKEMSAKETVEFINDYLTDIVPCITTTGGVIDKFLTQGGVVLMAVWGATESSGSAKDDAMQTIRSTLMMRAVLRNFNAKRNSKPILKMGCGINSGEVVAGQMGSDARMEYTIIGDAVNLAARIEGPNDAFDTDILISEQVKNLLGSLLKTKEMPSLLVKGKKDPLRVFSVINIENEEGNLLLTRLEAMPQADATLSKLCVGCKGPRTMKDVRKCWA